MTMQEHDAHVAGGVARWAAQTDWRATYGETPRLTRKQLVDQAKARLAGTSSFAPSSEVEETEPSALSAVSSSQLLQAPRTTSSEALAAGTGRSRVQAGWVGGTAVRAGSATGHDRDRGPTPTSGSVRESGGPARATRSRSQDLLDRDAFIVRTQDELTAKQQAEQLGINYGTLVADRGRLARQGRVQIKHYTFKHRPWTDEEQTYLVDHVGKISLEDIGKKLDRSPHGLMLRLKHKGISRRELRRRNSDTMTATQVADIMKVDIHDITRQWIGWGILKAARHPFFLAGGRKEQWAIRREDLVDFLIDNTWQYDRTRISDPFFRRVADEAWNRDPLYTTVQAAKILGFRSRDAGGLGQHGVSSFLKNTAPKFLSRDKLVIRRRGRPGSTGKSLAGMDVFVPRSTIRAIQTSGWINVRTIVDDPTTLSSRAACDLLMKDPARPPYVRRGVLLERLYQFFKRGVIPTHKIEIPNRAPWVMAKREDVLALRDVLFERPSTHMWPNLKQRLLIERHDGSWLTRPGELVTAMADGTMRSLLDQWMRAEFRITHPDVAKWAYVTKHVRRILESIGPRTKVGGRRRLRIYHQRACAPGLVEIPLAIARRRGLELCEQEKFERAHRGARRISKVIELPTCHVCGTTYQRGRGRPPKQPTCARCMTSRRAA